MVKHGNIDKNYTKIPNAAINDARLSFAALGLLAWLLSLIEDWRFSMAGIVARQRNLGRKVGKSALHTLVGELEAAGYIKRSPKPTRKADGTFDVGDWMVYASPHPVSDSPPAVAPAFDHPTSDAPMPMDQTQIKTNAIKTERNNTISGKTVQNQASSDELAQAVAEICREIDYDNLKERYPGKLATLNLIVNEMAAVEMSDADNIRIGSEDVPRCDAVGCFYALDTGDILKVMFAIGDAPGEIKHLSPYVRTALFNAARAKAHLSNLSHLKEEN